MQVNSVALASAYSSVLSLQNIDTNGPVGFCLSVGQTTLDTFELYGTLDAAAVDNTNAFLIGVFSGGTQSLPKGIASQATQWPFLLIRRTGGSTAGTLFVAGNPAADPGVVSTAAPVAAGDYSALLTLTTLNAKTIRIGASASMLVSDSFNVYVSNDSSLAALTGALLAGTITGGGGSNVNNTVLVSGFNYAIIRRVSGSTAGTIIASGVSPAAGGGGALSLTTLPVGNTAANGTIGALSAAASVDIYSSFLLTQTTAGVTATLPSPTVTTAGKVAFVMNASTATQSITMYGMTLGIGAVQPFEWTGAAWVGGQTITQNGNSFGAPVAVGSADRQPFILLGSQIDALGGPTIADGTGSIGLATATVDTASVILVNQTTPVVLYANMRTIPIPTVATVGRKVKIVNIGTAAFIIGDVTQKQGINIIPGTIPGGAASANKGASATFTFNGTAWVPDDGGPGTPVVAAGLADTDASIPRAGRCTVYRVASLAGSRVLTASLTGALIGDIIYIVRDDGGSAVTLTINNAAAAALCVMPASKKATAAIAYLGTGDWQLLSGGAF